MVESDSFPYVGEKLGNESQEHVHLKGLAVYWLLRRGFELDEILTEYAVDPRNKTEPGDTRYVDIYASDGEREIFIECERGSLTTSSVSDGGVQKAKSGEEVYVFGEDGIYKLEYCEKYVERFDDEVMTKELDEVSSLPILDLSAFE